MSTGIYLALGSNLGNREGNIRLGLRMLEPLVRVETVSPIYESEPQGVPEPQPPFYNAACRVVTGLTPELLLRHIKRIEHAIGRRETKHWGPRVIDVDIALFNDLVLDEEGLTIPHPRLLERAFVLRPLLDLDPDLGHPGTGERLADALSRLGEGGLALIS